MAQWKQYSGSWTLSQQMQARGSDEWPAPPGAPTIGTATAGNAQASVTFTAPANLGVPAVITQYTVTSSPGGITATGSASPITVTGLTNEVAYTFTVTATNASGTGPASAASNSVTPELTFKLYAWGRNNAGDLGLNNVINRSSPTQVGSLTTWKTVAGGNDQSAFAIRADGTLWSWGKNEEGTLGLNISPLSDKSSPTQVGALTNWSTISAGYRCAFAIKTDGTLWAWGLNSSGQLGQNDRVNQSSPVQVGALTDWVQISETSAGWVAIKTNGTLWACGNNNNGQLGQNNGITRSSPVQIGALTDWYKIKGGNAFWLATKTDGTLWACGFNLNGRLGDGTTINKSSPVQIGSLTTWETPGTSKDNSSLAIKTDGTLWTWGRNDFGQLGIGSVVEQSSPVQVGALTNWLDGFGSEFTVFCRKTDGTLWSWGGNAFGVLGSNTVDIARSSPVQIGSLTTWGPGAAAYQSAYSLLE